MYTCPAPQIIMIDLTWPFQSLLTILIWNGKWLSPSTNGIGWNIHLSQRILYYMFSIYVLYRRERYMYTFFWVLSLLWIMIFLQCSIPTKMLLLDVWKFIPTWLKCRSNINILPSTSGRQSKPMQRKRYFISSSCSGCGIEDSRNRFGASPYGCCIVVLISWLLGIETCLLWYIDLNWFWFLIAISYICFAQRRIYMVKKSFPMSLWQNPFGILKHSSGGPSL